MRLLVLGASLAATLLAATPALAETAPSRAPVKGCTWEKISDAKLGLEAWVQRCDFGFRKIDFTIAGSALAIRYSDGGAPEAVVDVFDLEPGETPEAGMKRILAARTDKAVAARCTLVPYHVAPPRPGAKLYMFAPDAAYAKELTAKADPDEVPEPPCGPFGVSPDGIQYFEAQPEGGARKLLFVRAGQDEPLFDERTLRLLPPS
jgi:hypothetical protein